MEKLKKELKKKAKGARGAQTKLNEAREVKKEILELTRQATTGSLHKSADLSTLARINGELKKEILTIYFYLLKTSHSTHLLQEVFIGIPKFTKLVNIELTANVLDVLREYLQESVDSKISDKKGLENILAGLVCAN